VSVVLLLSRQRSGTGALASVLEGNSNIFYCGEILDETCQVTSFFDWLRKNASGALSPPQICEKFKIFIDELIRNNLINIIDIKYNSLSLFSPSFRSFTEIPWILEYLSTIPVPIINLKRNILETFVSAKLAEQNNIYHATDFSDIHTNSISLNLEELKAYKEMCIKEDDFISKFFETYRYSVSIDYESTFSLEGDVTIDSMKHISKLLSIDFSSVTRTPRFVKQAKGSLIERIDNSADVMALLASVH